MVWILMGALGGAARLQNTLADSFNIPRFISMEHSLGQNAQTTPTKWIYEWWMLDHDEPEIFEVRWFAVFWKLMRLV